MADRYFRLARCQAEGAVEEFERALEDPVLAADGAVVLFIVPEVKTKIVIEHMQKKEAFHRNNIQHSVFSNCQYFYQVKLIDFFFFQDLE